MQVKTSINNKTEATLRIVATEQDVMSAKNIALKRLADGVKVPGFRKGHAPLNIIEKNIDSNTLRAETLELVLNNLYVSAVKNENLRPISNPDLSIKKFIPYTELEFEAKVSVVGKVTLADYKKISLAKKTVKVAKKEVDEVIKSLQTRAAERVEVDRAVKKTDEVTIDFFGKDKDGKAVSGADAKDYQLIIGSSSFIPGFEDNIVGMKPGSEKSFTLKFPKDYSVKALQNKDVTFDVELKKLSELKEPVLDDNFAAAVGPFKKFSELEEDIKKQLTLQKEQDATVEYENELIKMVTDDSKVDIPKALIDDQVKHMEDEEKRNLAYRGLTWEEHLKEDKITEEEHRKQNRPAAEQSVKTGIILAELSEVENVTVTPEELEVRIQMLKGQYKEPSVQSELDKPEVRRDLESRIRTEKTLKVLTSYATAKNDDKR